MNCLIYPDENRIKSDQLVASGFGNYVIHAEPWSVIKVPKLVVVLHEDGAMEVHPKDIYHMNDLEIEKGVYQGLQGVSGIAKLMSISPNSLTLEYSGRGFLRDYMQQHKPPPMDQRSH